jgi:hypothetical protein
MSKKIISPLFIFLFGFTLILSAETIEFKSGDVATLPILKFANDFITVQALDGAEQQLNYSQIDKIDGKSVFYSSATVRHKPPPADISQPIKREITRYQWRLSHQFSKLKMDIAPSTIWALMGLLYIAFCFPLRLIAEKLEVPHSWMAWIPIAQMFLILRMAGKPLWWFLLLLIPLVNIIIMVLVWMAVAQACGKSPVWGLTVIVPILAFFVIWYLALSKAPEPKKESSDKKKTNGEDTPPKTIEKPSPAKPKTEYRIHGYAPRPSPPPPPPSSPSSPPSENPSV